MTESGSFKPSVKVNSLGRVLSDDESAITDDSTDLVRSVDFTTLVCKNLVQMTDEIVTLGSAVGHTSGYLGGGKGVKGKNSTFNKRRGGKGGGEGAAAASSSTKS
jgi:hypothetical protein